MTEVEEVVVEVIGMLQPSPQWGEAFCVGHVPSSPSTLVGGWSPVGDRVVCQAADLTRLPSGLSTFEALLFLPALSIHAAIAALLPVPNAAVLGSGVIAALVRSFLLLRHVPIVAPEGSARSELLIDTRHDVEHWAEDLAVLVDEGTLLRFVAPWTGPSDVNFYPDIHRRSLQVVARRWHGLSEDPSDSAFAELTPLVAEAAGALLGSPALGGGKSETHQDAWQFHQR